MDVARNPTYLKHRRWKRMGLTLAGVIVVTVAAVAVMRLRPAPPSVDGGSVWPDQVKRGTMVRQVHGLGTLVPEEIRSVPAITDGRVEDIPVLPGTVVKPDTVLVVLQNPATEKTLSDAQVQLRGAEADLANLKATTGAALLEQKAEQANLEASYREAKLLSDNDEGLLAKGLVSRLDAQTDAEKTKALDTQVQLGQERITSMQASDQAQIESQQAKIQQQQDAVEFARSQIAAFQVRAGINGLLESLDLGGGQTLQRGQWVAAGTTVARVVQPQKLKAEVKIAETDVRDVSVGLPASIDTHNGLIAGHVTRIDPNSQNGTVTVDVGLDGPAPAGARPDLSVDGTINIETLKDVVYVGRPAFGQPNSTVSMFRILPGGEEAERVRVQLGKTSVNTVQILNGLQVGEWVVLSDTSAQDNFERIRFSPPIANVPKS